MIFFGLHNCVVLDNNIGILFLRILFCFSSVNSTNFAKMVNIANFSISQNGGGGN